MDALKKNLDESKLLEFQKEQQKKQASLLEIKQQSMRNAQKVFQNNIDYEYYDSNYDKLYDR